MPGARHSRYCAGGWGGGVDYARREDRRGHRRRRPDRGEWGYGEQDRHLLGGAGGEGAWGAVLRRRALVDGRLLAAGWQRHSDRGAGGGGDDSRQRSPP